MAEYLLIESRDPFTSHDCKHHWNMARDLAGAGNKVTLFLVENGVLPARPSAMSKPLSDLAGAGVEILADEFSLRERGIDPERLTSGVTAAPLEVIIDGLATGRKTIWH